MGINKLKNFQMKFAAILAIASVQALEHVNMLTAIDGAFEHVEMLTAIDGAFEHVEMLTAIDEAFEHVDMLTAIDEAFEHVDMMVAIDEAFEHIDTINTETVELSYRSNQNGRGSAIVIAAGSLLAIGAGFVIKNKFFAVTKKTSETESLL